MHQTVIVRLSRCLTCFAVDVWCRLLDSKPLECICHDSPSRAVWGLKLTPWWRKCSDYTSHLLYGKGKERYISVVQSGTATHWNSSASSTTQHRAELSNQSSHHQLRIINMCKLLHLQHFYCILFIAYTHAVRPGGQQNILKGRHFVS